jgi:hypothetical protein
MSCSRYTTLPVNRLPYPEGLGKTEYKGLERGIKQLLGSKWDQQSANEEAFWNSTYQDLIRTHLAPIFDRHGDIVENAAVAAAARASNVFDEVMNVDIDEADRRYRAGLPSATTLFARLGHAAATWALFPPSFYPDGPVMRIADGRHRLSYLRSLIQPRNPSFPVLVRIDE